MVLGLKDTSSIICFFKYEVGRLQYKIAQTKGLDVPCVQKECKSWVDKLIFSQVDPKSHEMSGKGH